MVLKVRLSDDKSFLWLTVENVSCSCCAIELAQRASSYQHGIRLVSALPIRNLDPHICLVKILKPETEGRKEQESQPTASKSDVLLPQTLVRIPIEDQDIENQELT